MQNVDPRDLTSDPFWRFEHDGWERVAEAYSRTCALVTKGFMAPLLAALEPGPPDTVLDVACGPGDLAAEAAGRGASVVAVDFSEAVVERAKTIHPALDVRHADAHALPFADASFTVVACSFGVLHFADPERFFAEARRVLQPRGRLGFTVWADVPDAAFNVLGRAVSTHGVPVPLPEGPPFFRFADEDECDRTLSAAGFDAVTFSTLRVAWDLEEPTGLFDALLAGTVRTAPLLAAQPPDRLEAIRAATAAEVARLRHGDSYEVPMTAHLVTATAAVNGR